jgi:hypothetical protein
VNEKSIIWIGVNLIVKIGILFCCFIAGFLFIGKTVKTFFEKAVTQNDADTQGGALVSAR